MPETKEFLQNVVKSLPRESRSNAKITLKRNKKKGHAQVTIQTDSAPEPTLREADFRLRMKGKNNG